MIKDTGEHISSPQINKVVFYKPWQGKNDKRKKAYPVIINDGQYLDSIFHRLSNFWSWQRVSPTGRINPKVENGYGNFTVANGFTVHVIEDSTVSDEGTTKKVQRKIYVND